MSGESRVSPATWGQVSEAVERFDFTQARSLLAGLSREDPTGLVRAAGDLFDGQGDPIFLVITPYPDLAAAALHRAALRFWLITEYGDEVSPEEADSGEVYTPNFVSDVAVTYAGLLLSVDAKSSMSDQMAMAMLRVLALELVTDRVPAYVSAPPPCLDRDLVWDAESGRIVPVGGAADRTKPRAWFILRHLHPRQVRGIVTEYRCPDGTWTTDPSRAERFAEPPNALVTGLRAQGRAPGQLGHIQGALLPTST